MSRVATQPTTQPSKAQSQGTPASTHTVEVPCEKIAMRAYEKWCKRGCPQGTPEQDWLAAEAELRAEMTRSCSTSPRTARC